MEGPLFPLGIRIRQVSTGPVEAAGNGLRHQAACLYHCNRQVGPGEWASVVLMPLASSRLLLDEQSDCLLPDSPVVFVCICVRVSMYDLFIHSRLTLAHANVSTANTLENSAYTANGSRFACFSLY